MRSIPSTRISIIQRKGTDKSESLIMHIYNRVWKAKDAQGGDLSDHNGVIAFTCRRKVNKTPSGL